MSLPSRERGLKRKAAAKDVIVTGSLPSRERGLKLPCRYTLPSRIRVAPFTGAWIETRADFKPTLSRKLSLPSRERGLKRTERCDVARDIARRSLHGSVD